MASPKKRKPQDQTDLENPQGTVVNNFGTVINKFFKVVDDVILSRISFEQRVGFVFLSLLIVGGLTALYLGLRQNEKPVMTGEFRIAIASFAESSNNLPKAIGFTVGDGINQRLVADLEEISVGPRVEIWGPERVGTVTGATSETRAKNAEKLAKEIHAYMVIYGVVSETEHGMLVTPEFYLQTDGFHEGSEVIGQYGLGSPFPLPSANNPAWQFDFDKQMRTRSDIISSIAVGLSYFAVHNYEGALESFQNIETIEGWNDDQGKEVLYALIGFSAGKAKNYDLTKSALEKAIAINPDYSRPYIGMANLNYILALEPFNQSKNVSDIDQTLLDQCFEYLELAVQAPEKPPLAEVETKIHFSRGQCYWLKTYTGQLPNFDQAIADFQAVIAAYNNGANPRVYEFAGESHARLGLIYHITGKLGEAATEYQMAADILKDIPERQQLYQKRADELKQENLITATP